MDDGGAVAGFAPRGRRALGSWHFIGIQVVNADVFSAVPSGVPTQSIGGIYNQLIDTAPGSVRGVALAADFMDIGSISDYRRTSARLSEGQADIGARSRISPTARVTASIIWDDVVVGDGAVLEECIVTDGVHVPAGAQFRRSVLLGEPHGQLSAIAIPSQP
jgi:NDP-sugar pyrophosphorylase family protein